MADAPVATETRQVPTKASFMPDLPKRRMLMGFLDRSYKGGVDYKRGTDGSGMTVLIAHEAESSIIDPKLIEIAAATNQGPVKGQDPQFGTKFLRRLGTAAYENHVKPILEIFSAYLTMVRPERAKDVQPKVEILKLDDFMSRAVDDALQLTEAWIGWDAHDVPGGDYATKADAAATDPLNKGEPYLVRRDPRSVVDFEVDADSGRVIRVVFEELEVTKATLTAMASRVTYFREWTETEWSLYKAVKQEGAGDTNAWVGCECLSNSDQQVVLLETNKHLFSGCPWVRLCIPFPTEDIADLNRLLFNIQSLLNEEQYSNTFTQKWITGLRPDQAGTLTVGAGQVWLFQDPNTKIGALGAMADQAASLMERVRDIREAIYKIVCMETSAKNQVEAAEKKKRDMERLYTMLVKVTARVEAAENALLVGLGLADEKDSKTLSVYSTGFDVEVLSSVLDDLKKVNDIPFIPNSFKRAAALMVMSRIQPRGDVGEFEKEAHESVDGSLNTAQAVELLRNAGTLTADMAIALLGVPLAMQADFKTEFDKHATAAQALSGAGGFDAGSPDAGGGVGAAGADGSGASGGGGSTANAGAGGTGAG